jgi:hypothetical protein
VNHIQDHPCKAASSTPCGIFLSGIGDDLLRCPRFGCVVLASAAQDMQQCSPNLNLQSVRDHPLHVDHFLSVLGRMWFGNITSRVHVGKLASSQRGQPDCPSHSAVKWQADSLRLSFFDSSLWVPTLDTRTPLPAIPPVWPMFSSCPYTVRHGSICWSKLSIVFRTAHL